MGIGTLRRHYPKTKAAEPAPVAKPVAAPPTAPPTPEPEPVAEALPEESVEPSAAAPEPDRWQRKKRR